MATAGMVGLLAFLLGVSRSMASDRTAGEGLQPLLRDYTGVRIAAIRGSDDPAEAERRRRSRRR